MAEIVKDLAPNFSSRETDTDDFMALLDELLDDGEPRNVLERHVCGDEGSFKGMCCVCGKRLEKDLGVPLGYIHKGLRLGNNDVVRLRIEDLKHLSRNKKLYLVLDLDHTLLNSTEIIHLIPDEEYLKTQTHPLQDVSQGNLFMLDSMRMMTKLRPFVKTFLKEASKMFEMYIYTMGDRRYALEMAKLLDPGGMYFSNRVISRDDGTQRHEKGLDVVLGHENAIVILDDTENAWKKHKDNLILMERYHFFASSCHQFGDKVKSLSELQRDECELDGALASILKVLKQIHRIFFEELEDDIASRDVRKVLKKVRKTVLKGCKIVFSHVFPNNFQPDMHPLWQMAERLGATCSTNLDSSVTHIVSPVSGTEKCRWAQEQKKFLVHPRWLEAANFLWQRQPEESFHVSTSSKHH